MSTELKLISIDQQNPQTNTAPVSQNETLRIPINLEASLTILRIIVMVLGVQLALISLYTGSTIQIAVIRGSIAALTLSLLTWFLNWFINQYLIEEGIADNDSEYNEKRR